MDVERVFAHLRPKWSVIFEVTNDCNLRCPFCYVIREKRLKRTHVSLEDFEKVLKIYKPLYLQMTGGEATIHPEFIKLIKISFKYVLVSMQISTNGLLVHKYVKELASMKRKPIIGISLDAPNELHDTIRNRKGLFNRIMKTVYLLKENQIPHAFATTIFGKGDIPNLPEGNLHLVDDIIALSEKLQVSINLQPFSPAKKETRIVLGKKLLKSRSKYIVNSIPYRKMLIDGNWTKCRYRWTHVSINSRGKELPVMKDNCYFCDDCSKCYYSCVWEPTLLTSSKFLPAAGSLLKQGLLLGAL
ncbi:MAG: radical SAM protein [Candidatus Helarchaeales archaeon]